MGNATNEQYAAVTEASKKLGYHGICPEALVCLRSLHDHGFIGDPTLETAVRAVLADFEAFFAPDADDQG